MKKALLSVLCLGLSYVSFAQSDYFWVGGSGDWSDFSNHWATTSGGSTFQTQAPTSLDNVYFDANSFTAIEQIVTLDGDANCNDMSWNGASNFPSFNYGSGTLNIYGSLVLSPDVTYSINKVDFESSSAGNTITSNGNSFGIASQLNFNGTGEWTLQDDFEFGSINFQNGTLTTNNFNVTGGRITMSLSNARTLNMGSSSFDVGFWDVQGNNITINAGTSTISSRIFKADQLSDGPYTYYNLILNNPTSNTLNNSAIFNQITLTSGSEVTVLSGSVITVGNLVADGTKFTPIDIHSSTGGNEATFNAASGTINTSYLSLTDIHATGAATFNADQSIDNGNNTGWNITPISTLNYFWIGDGGNWSDQAHWAKSSGGATTYGDYPGQYDNAIFDANSFSSTNQTVTADIAPQCNDMNWTGVTNQPTISSPYGQTVSIYGSATFTDGVTIGVYDLTMKSSNAGNTFTSGNSGIITFLNFNGPGEWTLQNDLLCGNLGLREGTLNLNGVAVESSGGLSLYYTPGTSSLNMGSSYVTIGSNLVNQNSSSVINAGTSTIKIGQNFDGEGATFNKVIFDGSSNITGANTFASLEALPGASLTFEAGVTQTVTGNITLVGTSSNPISINSSSAGVQGTLSKASGSVDATYLVLQDNAATGGATFNATQTVNNGNNAGWNITEITGVDYYWVGNSGNWSDFANHWVKTSGGSTFHTVAPGLLDNVFFDQNSFTLDNQTVTLDQSQTSVHDIDASALNRPVTLSDGSTINIYGSVNLSSNFSPGNNDYKFLSVDPEIINAPIGLNPNSSIYFQGTGSWDLQNDLTIGWFYLESGTFNTSNNNLSVTYEMKATTTAAKTLNLGTSTVFAKSFDALFGENLTINGGSSSFSVTDLMRSGEGGTGNSIAFGNFQVIKGLNSCSITENNLTVNNMVIDPGVILNIGVGLTITVNALTAMGTVDNNITIKSTTPGIQATISQAAGTVDGQYLILQDNNATGGATFNVLNSIDNGNVTGWNFVKQSQTITFNAISNKSLEDAPFSITASASSGLPVTLSVISGPITLDGTTVTITGAGEAKIQASQSGNTDYYAAASVINTFQIAQQPQTITFDALTQKTFGDTDFDLTATSNAGLTISYSSSDLTVATISGATVTIVGAGSTTITASQAGTTDISAATPVDQLLTVAKADQTITFDPIPSKAVGNPDFTLSATSDFGLPITYTSSDVSVATVSGNTVTIVALGNTTITASQAGNTNVNPAQTDQVLSVKSTQTITFDALAAKTYRDANFDLAATASSTLPVTFTSSDATVATISGNTVTIVGAGSTIITAAQAGNNSYLAATNVEQTLTVNKADQTITFDALTDKLTSDAPFNLTATASSGLTVSYASSDATVATVSGSTVTIVGVGTATITASQVGNTNFNAATDVVQTLTVGKGNQTITFDALASKTILDANFDLTATASSSLSVSYSSSDETVATIAGSTVTIVGVGSTVITASQAGNSDFNAAADVAQTLTVSKADQTITFDALSGKTVSDANFDLAAVASSGLAVSYTSSDETVATIASSTVTIVGAGTTTITASQAGDATYNAATDVTQTLTVNKQEQTITFDALADKTFGDASFDLTATASSGLTVSYTSSDETVATIAGSTVTIIGAGSTTITASQAGDALFNPATDVVQTLTVNKQDQTITFDAIAEQLFEDGSITLAATSSSGLAVSYELISGPATVAANVVTFTGLGVVTVKASQAGDDVFNPAPPVEQSFEIVTVTGLGLANESSFKIYPNPASSFIQISKDYQALQIVNMNGTIVYQTADNRKRIDINSLQSGNYILMIVNTNGVETKKFLKK
jgi:type IX secretion system substrate protein